MQTQKIHISELPTATIDCTCDDIAQFTVGLTRIFRDRQKENLELIGTGTLVLIQGSHCILTAEHVLATIRNTDQLGVMPSFSGGWRRHAFDRSHLRIHRIAKGENDSKGPDIGLIVLPEGSIGSLRAEVTFFNIDKRRERFAQGFLGKNRGFWFTLGIVGESEMDLGPRPGFAAAKGYYGICGASGIAAEYEDSDFDYLEVEIDYGTRHPELPRSFGGCSGAGVWQMPLKKDQQGEITPEEDVLSGVVFYQTAVENDVRRLRCHGRKTVYVKVPEFLDRIKGS